LGEQKQLSQPCGALGIVDLGIGLLSLMLL
jgi:hypothetical protein